MKKKLSLLLAIMLCITMLLPFSAVTANAAQKATIKLNKSALSISLAKTYTLKATVTGKSQTVTWTTSNKNVVKVTKKGVVKPVNVGRAVITATANGKKATCVVTVYSADVRLNDFRGESSINKITMGTPYIDNYSYLAAGSYTAYFDYYQHQAGQYNVAKAEVIKTLRGITLGATKKDVIVAYGNGTEEKFDKTTDKIYMIQSQSFGKEYFNGTKTLKNAKSVLVYTYGNNTSYAMRFYFDKNDKLISIVYTKNYSSFNGYGNWNHY
ncbi:Ig-like domain-containing protein [Butyrivibrio sp. YAB3001]|uniref:Ig-like domain-containing protein n=1 Tax=Butyrivibrio sp. YAB3001 TaxID=1520812 RepID=UPI0008F62CD3|nr:Ig-like domain-containing protein [Butyrivibrio sp. YAB3001]SFB72931.1 Ig-like domain (group 2) [Butyrivibrio sp. YAB3001]